MGREGRREVLAHRHAGPWLLCKFRLQQAEQSPRRDGCPMVRTCDGKGAKKHKKNTHLHQTFTRWQPHMTENHTPKLHLYFSTSLTHTFCPSHTHDASPQTKIHTHYHTYSKPYARPNKGQDDKVPPQDCRQMPRRPSKKLPSRGVTKRPKGKHEIATYNPRCAPECSRAKFSQSALYGGVVKTKRSSEILW